MPGPTVELEFTGNESDLVRSTENVGEAFDKVGEDVGRASRQMSDESGGAFDTMEEGADTAETRFTGFADTLGGATEALAVWNDESMSTSEKLMALGQAGADFAGGLAGFVVPAMKSAAGFMAGPLRAAMTFISAHPLLLTLGILIGLFVTLWTTSETFRNIVLGVFSAVGNFVKNVFGGAIGWIVDRWNGMVDWFKNIPRRIGEALAGVGSAIGGAFKSALNVGIDVINWFIDRANDIIYGINVVSPFDDIPNIPKVARLQTGGKAQRDGMAFLHAGETVRSAAESGRADGGGTLEVVGDDSSWLYKMIKKGIRDGKLKLA